MQTYVDRLMDEIRATHARMQKWDAKLPDEVDSIYFGGGTPSILHFNQMHSIHKFLHDVFRIPPEAEITLECAPGQLSEELLVRLTEIGFNRVSLGVQSFVDREARTVGRLHTRAIAEQQIADLRRAGIENINVDLIAGLPHQTPESWQASLEAAVATGVPHLSVYMLDVDEDSRLGREMLAGGSRYHADSVPEDEAIAAMYAMACGKFAAAGIAQYEISNFARAGWESRHNRKYWTRQPYLGFGLDAHSFFADKNGGEFRMNTTDDLDAWMAGTEPEMTVVTARQAIEEMWFLGLRLNEGVDMNAMRNAIGGAAMTTFEPVMQECLRDGVAEIVNGHFRLTARGRLFANDVFARFIGVLDAEDVCA
jgi:oxygen-independent coproporphyrinogen-3 oxidase